MDLRTGCPADGGASRLATQDVAAACVAVRTDPLRCAKEAALKAKASTLMVCTTTSMISCWLYCQSPELGVAREAAAAAAGVQDHAQLLISPRPREDAHQVDRSAILAAATPLLGAVTLVDEGHQRQLQCDVERRRLQGGLATRRLALVVLDAAELQATHSTGTLADPS